MSPSAHRKRLHQGGNVCTVLALIFQVAGRGMSNSLASPQGEAAPNDGLVFLMLVLVATGFTLWVIGLSLLAQSKGASKWFGALGLLSFLGWIVVYLLPDQWHERYPAERMPGDYPRPNETSET